MRRAIRHGRMLGLDKPFLHTLAVEVAELMKGAYPDLHEAAARVAAVVEHEEKNYDRTLRQALGKLDEEIEKAAIGAPGVRTARRADGSVELADGNITLPGEVAFRLYDTFGLSLDLLEDEGSFRGFRVDRAGFERAMEEQRTRAKASWKGAQKEIANPAYAKLAETFHTEPDFYFETHTRDCCVEAIVTPRGLVKELVPGEEGEVVLDRTVIYAESGGQVADIGVFLSNDLSVHIADVRGAYYPIAGLIAHKVQAKEKLCVGDRIAVQADGARREHIKRNHTGTHLVHAALRNILGTHVKQSGSLNDAERLRFDFTHYSAVGLDELREIEEQVNEQLLLNNQLETDILPLEDALASGALAFFGDRYPEQNVRVVTVPDARSPRGFYSKELCGGTHVHRSGEIGVFKIISEQSVASGVRRIEAITGERARDEFQRAANTLRQIAEALNTREDEILATIERLTQTARQLEKQLEALKKKSAHSKVDELLSQARTVKDVRVLSAAVGDVGREAMRQLVDTLRQKLGSGVVVLGAAENGKVALIAGVTKDLTSKLHAGKIIQEVARQVGGSGGGRPDLAEAGGKDTSALESALSGVYSLVERML
jgi:alanyl-tRNA synthetase